MSRPSTDSDVAELHPTPEHKSGITQSELFYMGNHMIGKLLTIIDATVPVGSQNKSVKSLVRNAVWDDIEQAQSWLAQQQSGMRSSFPFYQPDSALPEA